MKQTKADEVFIRFNTYIRRSIGARQVGGKELNIEQSKQQLFDDLSEMAVMLSKSVDLDLVPAVKLSDIAAYLGVEE